MNEEDLGRKLARTLNQAAAQLRPDIVERLAGARRQALSKAASRKRVWNLAWATSSQTSQYGVNWLWVSVAALILVVASVAYWPTWHSPPHENEEAAIDAALLADDLPLNAYTDWASGSWLKPASE